MTIAILDSGIRADHAAFAPGQVAAWYDFTDHRARALAAWDPLVATPYDDLGHGTAVAAMAAGLPYSTLTPSHAPGARLAVGKVLTASNGAAWYDVARGIRWAVDVAGADVISLSIYSYQPRVGGPNGWSDSEQALFDALAYARANGVLPVVLAGNGYDNGGLPTMSWLSPPAVSTSALVVGGVDATVGGAPLPQGSWDPEVAAPYTVVGPCITSATCVRGMQGTSFSTPLVAGAAAHLLAVAREQGLVLTPDDLEDMLKRSATDTPLPPSRDGYGLLRAPEVAAAEQRIRSSTPFPQADPVSAAYVETLGGTERRFWMTGGV